MTIGAKLFPYQPSSFQIFLCVPYILYICTQSARAEEMMLGHCFGYMITVWLGEF